MAKRKAVMEVCDNPACLNEFESTKDEAATGFHFNGGYWVLGGGGPIPAFYACSRECIMPAFEAALKERG